MKMLLFVYGTLKRGCSNHGQLAGQTFVGSARTVPGFRLYDLGGFPGIAEQAEDREGVAGEVWSVDAEALRRLDAFEGVHEGLYRRQAVALQPPFAGNPVETYVPSLGVAGRREVGAEWCE
jgi:gamma-glutamylaminecyclotransferase